MKQRNTFEPSDFRGCGQIIVRNSFPIGSTEYDHATTVSYKIGFLAGNKDKKILKISLADGMTIQYRTINDLCNALNNDEYGYRPMNEKEIQIIMKVIGNRFGF